MNFIPDQGDAQIVPFYSDATSEDGWKGQATNKKVSELKSEVSAAIGRMGGMVISFQSGMYQVGEQTRQGFRVRYILDTDNPMPGQLDIAALPVKTDHRKSKTLKDRKDKSLRMALFMLRDALDGMRFLQLLSPGFAGLMPWMLGKDGKTITQLWSEQSSIGLLLPPVEAEWKEVK